LGPFERASLKSVLEVALSKEPSRAGAFLLAFDDMEKIIRFLVI
jgi:hypothetical protein